jgi:prepilin-type N-terminal cleavage/methylation domain-containing protein
MVGKPAPGFTLLEVLVAMVIMAATLVTLLLMQSGTIRLAGAGRFTGMIPILAEGVLADQMTDPSGFSQRSGDFSPEFEGLEWTCTLADVTWDDPANLSDQQLDRLKKIEITISAPGTGRSWSMISWRYKVESDD